MAQQATEQGGRHPPGAAAAAADPNHPLQTIAAPPSPPAGGEGCRNGSAVAGLPDDILLEILSRLPVKPLSRFKCVSKAWSGLVADCLRKIPRTLQGFFYSDDKGENNNCVPFLNLLGRSVPPSTRPSPSSRSCPRSTRSSSRIPAMGSCYFCISVQEHTRKKAILCATRPPGNGCLCLARALSARTNMDIRSPPAI
ncbi:uncharacterized protein LOC120659579 [Panicum virgatum]|uniref:F-box domain-containing protein n=1 Tax=Panicum virgatum TaxID=38727 RepID=A0A8T0V740_PANVG|nr:uncharacterized protein LOC120659579 [Panicum virgatum]KAG2632201.1 hypothetical protein PVAP13_2NG069446 [Panicum virgatum]KAG2632202.1 hypothetical protein PVAP13_2NG069446 [Panicum virgatum]KAG2632203.1 hypothetical protein PVAP13_2NG069446 [Panicum virgatum]KAG2632204.1 hypothetical protein PVAP13_2NG069446 [Panicum virgatum]